MTSPSRSVASPSPAKALSSMYASTKPHAPPSSYSVDGKQYVVVIATGGSYLGSPAGGDSVMAFTLP